MLLALVPLAFSQTLQVSQPVQLTNGSFYERGASVAYDGSAYYLFYGMASAGFNGTYQSGNPDSNDYALYYKRAFSVAGLASAPAMQFNALDGTPLGIANVILGETAAAYYNGMIWVFALVDPDTSNSGDDAYLYGWYTSNGGSSWTQTEDLGDDLYLNDGVSHVDSAAFGGSLWLLTSSGDSYTQRASVSPEFSSSWSDLEIVDTGRNDGNGRFYPEGDTLRLATSWQSPSSGVAVYQYDSDSLSWVIYDSADLQANNPQIMRHGGGYILVAGSDDSEGGGRR
jgi:hypothetical protein